VAVVVAAARSRDAETRSSRGRAPFWRLVKKFRASPVKAFPSLQKPHTHTHTHTHTKQKSARRRKQRRRPGLSFSYRSARSVRADRRQRAAGRNVVRSVVAAAGAIVVVVLLLLLLFARHACAHPVAAAVVRGTVDRFGAPPARAQRPRPLVPLHARPHGAVRVVRPRQGPGRDPRPRGAAIVPQGEGSGREWRAVCGREPGRVRAAVHPSRAVAPPVGHRSGSVRGCDGSR